jgi:hypothetical protein
MNSLLFAPIANFLNALLAALFTTFLVPRRQHRFWKHQRFEELRLKVVNEVNELGSKFGVNYLHRADMPEEFPELGAAFAHSWATVSGQVKVLFSNSTCQEFNKMERIIFSTLLFSTHEVNQRIARVAEFTRTREAASRAFYKEMGIL